MSEYDYTKSVDYWIGFAEEAQKHLKYLSKKKRTLMILQQMMMVKSQLKEAVNRMTELGASTKDIARLTPDD